MQKFQWLLNPRQVFDLTQGGPGPAIEMFRHVPNIKLLACGGDGTVGWLLSVLDKVTIDPPPAVGVLPLGTLHFHILMYTRAMNLNFYGPKNLPCGVETAD